MQQVAGAPQTIGLERREVYLRRCGLVSLLADLGAVTLPEHPQVDQLGRVKLETRLEQRGEVVVGGLIPQLVEPFWTWRTVCGE